MRFLFMRFVLPGFALLAVASLVFAANYCVYDLNAGQCVAPAPAQNTVLGFEPWTGGLLVLAFFLSIVTLVSYFITNKPETREYWMQINQGTWKPPVPIKNAQAARKPRRPGGKKRR